MKRMIVVLSLVSMLFVGLAADAFAACPPGDWGCQAREAAQSAQSWGQQFQQGAQSFGNTMQNGGFWNNGFQGGWQNTPSVPGAGTTFGWNGQQWGQAVQRFNNAWR